MNRAKRFYLLPFLLIISIIVALQFRPIRAAERGGLLFIDQDSQPISGTLRILCLTDSVPTTVLSDNLRTTSNGALTSGLPMNCPRIAALHLRHTQPAAQPEHGPAYWIYTTSWQAGETTGQVPNSAIVIDDANALTLFNVAASIGWEPAIDSDVLTVSDVQMALEGASAEIYDWTEGHAAFGPIFIGTNGEDWRLADLRFLPNNDQRPGAYVGGIVADNLEYPLPNAPAGSTTTYVPGTTFYGREWRGNIAGANGVKTIAHEWMHYAFFLYDEYVQNAGPKKYCVCDDLPAVGATGVGGICDGQAADLVGSAMAFHYVASELWHEETHDESVASCYASQQYRVHDDSDWETLNKWDTIQDLGLPFEPFPYPSALVSGPEPGLTGLLFGRTPPHSSRTAPTPPSSSRAAASEPAFTLHTPDRTNTFTTTVPSQIYILKGDKDSPERIQYQGRVGNLPDGTKLGDLSLLGVDSNDFLRAYADEYEPASGGRSLVYPANSAESGLISGGGPINAEDIEWNYKLETDIALLNSRPQTMTVYLASESHALTNAKAQLCSQDLSIGCLPQIDMSFDSGASLWRVDLVATELGLEQLPAFSIIRVVSSDAPYPNEIIRWVQLAGSVGPAYIDGLAPLADDRVMVLSDDENADAPDCNFVSFMPASNVEAMSAGNSFTGILGQPLDITMRMSDGQECVTPPPCVNQVFDNDVTLVLFFDPEELTRLNIDASMLQVGHFNTDQPSWDPIDAVDVNVELGYVSVRTNRDGIFVVTYNRPKPTGTTFLHTATAANTSGFSTTINHPSLNGVSSARPIITHNWNPTSRGGTYNDHNVGVVYDNTTQRWQIFNQDMAAMPLDVAFNVLVPADSQTAYVHQHNTTQNMGYDETYLDYPNLNFFSGAKLFFTQNRTPNNVYNDRVTGAAYDNAQNKWVIQNSLEIEFDPVPNLAAYNVLIPTFDQDSFIHTAGFANTELNITQIDHPRLNENPEALVFITPRWPFSNSPTGNWHPTGVFYNVTTEKWGIFNEDGSSMPIGAQFNVLVPTEPARVPTAVGMTAPSITPPRISVLHLTLILVASIVLSTLIALSGKRRRPF